MKKLVKIVIIFGVLLIVFVAGAIVILPRFINVQKYKPEIEKKVTDATGRPFTLGGNINLSLFPWIGVRLTDLHLGNPEGFSRKDFVSVKSFEVRVKLLPLLSRRVEIKKFVLVEPRIVLEKNKKGRKNWEGIGKPAAAPGKKVAKKNAKKKTPSKGPGIKSLKVGEFAIRNASLLYLDDVAGTKKEISNFNLSLKNVSLNRPVELAFSALFNGKPVSLVGKLGPIGSMPPAGSIPVDLKLRAFDELKASLKGKVSGVAGKQYQMSFNVEPFSLKKILKELGSGESIKTSDPKALEKLALHFKVDGNTRRLSITGGSFILDDSRLDFALTAVNSKRPDITFSFDLDHIDLDRYLPPKSASEEGQGNAGSGSTVAPGKSPAADYSMLRKIKIDGIAKVGKLKVSGARIHDLVVKVKGSRGVFRIDPMLAQLYQGKVNSVATLDVRKKSPAVQLRLNASGIKVAPLLKDVINKDFLEGTVRVNAVITTVGDNAYSAKKNLNGKGLLLFTDGAIVGFDLPGMVRNIKATFGLEQRKKQKPKTDFSELRLPFTITGGVFKTDGAILKSPVLRVLASGTANLVTEVLNFRIEPKFVATLKGQGDEKKRSGVLVPVLVTGTFSSPKFRPDLAGMFKQQLKGGIPEPSQIKEMIGGKKGKKEGGKSKSIEEKSKGLLKSLPFGK